MRITFHEVKLYGEKSFKCSAGCGRRLQRRKKFYQTLNPFNKKKDGTPKEVDDIYQELRAELKVWSEQTEKCSHCERAGK